MAEWTLARRPLEGAPWRIVDVRSVVVGPGRFNAGLDATGSKALVHFAAFARLLAHLRATTPEGQAVAIRSDKHGGRHFYGGLLAGAFPDARVDRGPEGPELSRYEVIGPARTADPRASSPGPTPTTAWWRWRRSSARRSASTGWTPSTPTGSPGSPASGPTAGYPVDAARFRLAIEPDCEARGLEPARLVAGEVTGGRAVTDRADRPMGRLATRSAAIRLIASGLAVLNGRRWPGGCPGGRPRRPGCRR